MFVIAERFLSDVLDKYGKHQVSSDGSDTRYSQARRNLKLKHHYHLHSSYEKSVIERIIHI